MALWIAGQGHPNPNIVFIFVAGTFVMRAAGCVINDLVDRPFDGQVERTQNRPLVLKTVSVKEALLLFFGLTFLAFLLVLQLNRLTCGLSVIALILALIYPWMKRYIAAPQAVLGLAFGVSIPMAFAALNQPISIEAWGLYLATFCWVVAYDTEYAMVDRKDDLKLGIKSTAILFGHRDRWMVLGFQLLFLSLLLLLGWRLERSIYYGLGLLLALILAVYQFFLIFDRLPAACFQAFLNNNWMGASLFLGLALDYWLG